MSRVFLVGFMGAGKSRVGEALAHHLGCRFVDLDERLSGRFNMSIPSVFETHGEVAFRAAEREELTVCAGLSNVVVATGGGAFCSDENRGIIHSSNTVSVFLDVPWPVLRERLDNDHSDRPLYDNAEMAHALYKERLPDYRRAQVTVFLGGSETPEEAAQEIAQAIQEAPCAT
jgi:shikimate kinase